MNSLITNQDPPEENKFLHQGSRELTKDELKHLKVVLNPVFDSPVNNDVKKEASKLLARKCLREELTFKTTLQIWEAFKLDVEILKEIFSKPVQKGVLLLSDVLEGEMDRKQAIEIEIDLNKTIQKPFHYGEMQKEMETGVYLIINEKKGQTFRERVKYDNEGNPKTHKILVLEVALEKLTIYDSPISEEPRRFKAQWKRVKNNRPLIVGPCYREELITTLRDNNYIANKRFGEDVISGSLNLLEQQGKAEMKTDIETPGFFYNKNTNEIINAKYPVEMPDPMEIKQGFQVMEEFKSWFKGAETKLASIFKYGLISPFGFARKQMGAHWIPYYFLYGQPGSGKSRLGEMVLYMWEEPDEEKNDLGGGSFDTEARIGGALSKSTFAVVVDEPAGVLMKPQLVEILKNAVVKTVTRSKYNQGTRLSNVPSYSPAILTSNTSSPQDLAFGRRIETMNFTHSEKKIRVEQDEFDRIWQMDSPKNSKLNAFKAITQAVAVEIIADPTLLMKDWRELADLLLVRLFSDIGEKPPKWLLEWQKTETVQDIENEQKESIRILISTHLNREMKRIPLVDDEYKHMTLETTDKVRENKGFHNRVWYVINEGLIPWMIPFYDSSKDKNYVCLTIGFKKELQQELKICQTLKGISELMGWDYKSVRLPKPEKVIKIRFDKFVEMIYRRGIHDQQSL